MTDVTRLARTRSGGASVNVDVPLGPGTDGDPAYRYWNWDPSSDRDFTACR